MIRKRKVSIYHLSIVRVGFVFSSKIYEQSLLRDAYVYIYIRQRDFLFESRSKRLYIDVLRR